VCVCVCVCVCACVGVWVLGYVDVWVCVRTTEAVSECVRGVASQSKKKFRSVQVCRAISVADSVSKTCGPRISDETGGVPESVPVGSCAPHRARPGEQSNGAFHERQRESCRELRIQCC